ncbi:MAG: DUF983 domain-containing protein [Alphaproteobacteria bacterium]
MGRRLSGPGSAVSNGIAGRCPRCGRGPLFAGFLTVRQTCPVCGLDIARHDSGDGPAVLVILVLGAIVVALALWVEVRWEPPLWVHALLWIPFTLAVALAMLRPLKGAMVALDYRNRGGFHGPA